MARRLKHVVKRSGRPGESVGRLDIENLAGIHLARRGRGFPFCLLTRARVRLEQDGVECQEDEDAGAIQAVVVHAVSGLFFWVELCVLPRTRVSRNPATSALDRRTTTLFSCITPSSSSNTPGKRVFG